VHSMLSGRTIVFRKHMSVGAPAAEDDTEFLADCFVNSGDIDVIEDVKISRCVIVGRTGSGKSALIKHILSTEDHAIKISPEALSLTYISNSSIITYFEELGVKLDIFYQLLWRHVLCVELLRAKYPMSNETDVRSLVANLFDRFRYDPKKEAAIQYLAQWGESFWLETEDRVKEVTNKLESELQASAGAKSSFLTLHGSAAKKVTEEEKHEIISRAQQE
jgi:hypothetical protein